MWMIMFVIISVTLNAQHTQIDSLRNLISNTKTDTAKIILYENLAQAYRDAKKLDSSILAYKQALQLNQKNKYSPLKQCYNMSTIDYLYYVTGNYTKSLEYASKVLVLSEKLHDLPQMAHAHQQFGFNYVAFGDYRQALNHFFKAKQLFELHNHPEIDLESPAFATVYIGYIYLKINQPDSALSYVQSGYQLARKMSQRYVIDYSLRMLGDIYLAKNNERLTLNYYRQYINDFYKYDENNRDIDFVFYNMSKIFQKRNQNDSAVFYAMKALKSAKEYNDQENIYNAASILRHLNDSLNDESQAFAYFKIAEAAKDSMASIEKIRQIQLLTFNEQTREKELAEVDAKAAARTRLIIIIASIVWLIITFLIWNRIRQLRLKYKAILEQKELDKLKAKHEKEMLELEAKALRAQMNPHFIFNCMNSIKLLIQQQNEEMAINYLTTFSKLIRTIFQNSDKREITLYDEIETCRLYTQLESMRFENKFNYMFKVDETLDLKSIKVPALIIQPFIENAIWHGIMPKEDGGTVTVTINKTAHTICCIIDDDGIGRDLSKQSKFLVGSSAHESKGESLTQARLDLDNLLNERNASVEINDKKDGNNKPGGTNIILSFDEY